MSESTKKTLNNDGLLIAGVAGCVVAALAAIALFGGLSAERESRGDSAPAPTARALPSAAPATPSGEAVPARLPPADLPHPTRAPAAPAATDCDAVDGSWVAAGLAAWEARDHALAADCFARADEASADRPWVVYMHGLSLWKDGRLDEADGELSRALALDPGCVRCAVNLSRVRNDAGRFEGALEAAETALALDPDGADPRFLSGRSLRNLGRTAEAIEALERAVEAEPDHGYAHNLLGLTLLQADRELPARDHLERARDLLPEIAFVRNNLGMAYERCGRRDLAVVEYRAAVDLEGVAGHAGANLARLDPDGSIEAEVLLAATVDAPGESAGPAEIDSAGVDLVAARASDVPDGEGGDPGPR